MKIGFVGIGQMGREMSVRLIDAGHVDVVEPSAVDEHQGIGRGERAEAAHAENTRKNPREP